MLLQTEALSKSFGGVKALKNGSFSLQPGSVHALCGGNGAGKSTFLKIIMGIIKRDGGKIFRNGNEVEFNGPKDALKNGISIIEQELSPVPGMSVSENIFLGREPLRKLGTINFKKMNQDAQEILNSYSFGINAKAIMKDLSVAQLQLVEIAKALSHDSEVIIMDEPTSALGEAEAIHLFEAIKTMKSRGKGVVYVSHRLSEIFEIADEYTVFRDGEFITSGKIAEVNKDQLIEHIVGRALNEEYIKENIPSDKIALEVKNISATNRVKNMSFDVFHGEIFGIYGLMGSGRTEILERIFGLSHDKDGEILFDGKPSQHNSPRDAIDAGFAMVTEDRKGSGLNLLGSVRSNICVAELAKMNPSQLISQNIELGASKKMIEMFTIKTATDQLAVSSLSGGNQQKVVLGKWFLTNPKLLLLDEPTRGVDVGAKREIYKVMSDFARAGGTVIMVTSEIDEAIGMADRVLVLRDGQNVGILNKDEITAQKLVSMAA